MTRSLFVMSSLLLALHGGGGAADGIRRASPAPHAPPAATRIVELRSYTLRPGTRDRFHQIFVTKALPMLNRWHVDVVSYGPSLHDADSYYLMRAYASLEERQRSEDAFYGSDEWRLGPREEILACIDTYTTVVLRLDAAAVKGLRK